MKTIISNKIVALLSSLILVTNLSAQNDSAKKKNCDEYIKPSRYIFEGKVTAQKHISVKTGEHSYANYNTYLVEVRKVIRGNLLPGTIELLEHSGGIIYKDSIHTISAPTPDDVHEGLPADAIYFCKTGVNIKGAGYSNTNSKSPIDFGEIPLANGELVKQERGITNYFSTKQDFYDYLRANYGVKIEDK